MKDEEKTEVQLLTELTELRQQLAKLETEKNDRKRIEATHALEKSERLYRMLAENVSDVIWIMDMNLRLTYISPSVTRLLGFSVEEVMAKGGMDFLRPSSYQIAMNNLAEELAQETLGQKDLSRSRSQSLELELTCKNGSTIWAEVKMSFLRDSEGHPIGILGVSRDVTQRKQMEETLRESEQKYRSVVDNIGIGVALINPKMEILTLNKQMKKWFPAVDDTKKPICYRSFNIPPRGEVCSYCPSCKTLKTGEVFEAVTDTPAGNNIINYRIISSPIKDSNGNVIAAIEMVEDITEKKQAKDALQRAYHELELRVKERTADLVQANKHLKNEIEERKRAEEQTKKLQKYLQLQFDRMPFGAITWDTKFQVKSWNPAAERIFGFTAKEASGKHAYNLVVPKEAQSQVDDIWRRLLEGDETAHSINENVTKSGHTIICQWSNTPLREADGTVVGVLSMVQDITERKQMEDALRESEEKYRTLFEESRDATYITSREGKFIDANQATLGLFGYPKEELIDKLNIQELYLYPSHRDAFQQEIEQKGSVRNYEVKLRKKDSTKMDCLLTSTLRQSSDGRVLGYQGIIRDVTEFKQAEKALRESEARYRAVIEDQTELICRFLPDRKITFVNQAYCRYFRKKYEELIGHKFQPLIPEEDMPIAEKLFASLSQEIPVMTQEHRVILPDGEIRWLAWTNRILFNEKGQLVEFQSVGRDITRRKLMEEALEKSSEKIKLFAYSVSHDLKNPAIALYGLTKLLHKQYLDILDEKGKAYCQQIMKASEQIAALVGKINEYISTKELLLTIENVKLKETLQMVKEDFSPQLNIRQIRWDEPENLPEIKADRISLLRVFRNFIDNSLKYGGNDLSEIKIGYKESDEFHILSVKDDGVGIRGKPSEKIFGLFKRHETSKGIEGSGLGLAIVKEVAEQHGGKVWMEPGWKKGITFFFSISKNLNLSKGN